MTTKEKVLSALASLKNGDFISGEEFAVTCSVSRTAIWKAIRSLEESGYKIEAVTNRGYRLVSKPDNLDATEISRIIKDSCEKIVKIFLFDTIDSTNSEAKRIAVEAGAFRDAKGNLTAGGESANLSLFAAESQTGGKGRLGRSFISPKETGVYFSLLYSPKNGVKNPALYTAAAALAVVKSISKLYGEDAQIKWVNDVFLAEKKVCGILVEGIANFETGNIDAAVVGIGINIRQNKNLSGDIAKIVGSIEEAKLAHNKIFEARTKNELIAEVVSNLLGFYEKFENDDENAIKDLVSEYRAKSMLIGKTVTVNPVAGSDFESYRAKVKSISDEMKLVVENEAGEIKELSSGEVSLHSYDFASA
ncbi:biotin--[acetyl-CoA-carboxylase] ligase [uncultured Treponema sp.]|uniref:biotin--[acetyl-CoA-carboxylase] ligase n=1 Tax=uncultured Treponema sp. TaxID=162155 RepID=UPI0025D11511|nr:biotin--[acetyl-CoA-carboxylase] ligase [uncultured Treponema sp.]